MRSNINQLAKALPKWDPAKTMDDVVVTAPSLYEITHPYDSKPLQDDDNGDTAHSPSSLKVRQAQDSLYSDIRDARLAIDLFLNSRITECLDIVTAKRQSSMYHCLSYACLLAGTSILTFQRDDIAKAITAMKVGFCWPGSAILTFSLTVGNISTG